MLNIKKLKKQIKKYVNLVNSLDSFCVANLPNCVESDSQWEDYFERRYVRNLFVKKEETISLVCTYLNLYRTKLSNSEIFTALSRSVVVYIRDFDFPYAVEFYIDLVKALGLAESLGVVGINSDVLRADYYEWVNSYEC